MKESNTDTPCSNNGRISNDINSDSLNKSHLDTETESQPDIITLIVKTFTKAANTAETIPANQNESNDLDESMQKKATTKSTENPLRFQIQKLAIVLGNSLVKEADGYLLMGLINRKYIVKLRQFSSAKTADIKNYIKPTKRDFDPRLHILHIGTKDLTLEESPKTVLERETETTEYLKTETNIVRVFNIIARGDKCKEKGERLSSLRPSNFLKKNLRYRYFLVNHAKFLKTPFQRTRPSSCF